MHPTERILWIGSRPRHWMAVLVGALCGCSSGLTDPPPEPDTVTAAAPAGYTLVARLAHLSDLQLIDDQSPARFAPLDGLVSPAWRPQEAYSLHLLDGFLRAINHRHAAGETFDFALLTGDLVDNDHGIEWDWLMAVMDGERVDPLSAPDDRAPGERPAPRHDPHAPFDAVGLYRNGVHGTHPSIPWYAVVGNHDHFAVGNFQIFEYGSGERLAPIPITRILLPYLATVMAPEGTMGYGLVSPARPGPPAPLSLGDLTAPNPRRRYLNTPEIIARLSRTATPPIGHGFDTLAPEQSWYQATPVPGLRLIGLDSSRPGHRIPGFPYNQGSIHRAQLDFLQTALTEADAAGDLVVVATHHPSQDLWPLLGTAVDGNGFRELLASHPCVCLHLAGHTHRHRVVQRDGYLEIETASTLDFPQEGRTIEIWRGPPGQAPFVRYAPFSHLDGCDTDPDPYCDLRREASTLATMDAGLGSAAIQFRLSDESVSDPLDAAARRRWLAGNATDRAGGLPVRGARSR